MFIFVLPLLLLGSPAAFFVFLGHDDVVVVVESSRKVRILVMDGGCEIGGTKTSVIGTKTHTSWSKQGTGRAKGECFDGEYFFLDSQIGAKSNGATRQERDPINT
jgi:hypothetical protein